MNIDLDDLSDTQITEMANASLMERVRIILDAGELSPATMESLVETFDSTKAIDDDLVKTIRALTRLQSFREIQRFRIDKIVSERAQKKLSLD